MAGENQNKMIEKKERILESAIKLFSKNGYDATTIGEIAKEANVSFGLVSTYFGNKENLYTLCVTKPAEVYFGEMLLFNTSSKSYEDDIKKIIQRHIKIISNKKDYLQLFSQVNNQYERFPEAFHVANNLTQKLVKKIEDLICNGQSMGQLTEGNSEKIAIAYVSLLLGLRLSYADNPADEDWIMFTDIALRLFGPK